MWVCVGGGGARFSRRQGAGDVWAGGSCPLGLFLPSTSRCESPPHPPLCSAPPGSRRQLELQLLIPRYKEALSKAKAAAFTAQGVLADPDLMGEVLMYYRWGGGEGKGLVHFR